MQTLDLNLASRPFRNNTLLWAALLVASVLIVGSAAWSLLAFREHRGLIEDLLAKVGSHEELERLYTAREERSEREIRRYDLDALEIQASKANEVIRRKAFSWTELFNRLQDVQPWNVKMTSVSPVFHMGPDAHGLDETAGVPVAAEGLAKTVREFLELERALVQSSHFDRVEPVGYNTDGVTGETVFRLKFLYYPWSASAPEAADTATASAPAEAEPDAEPGVEGDTAAEIVQVDAARTAEPAGEEAGPAAEAPIRTAPATESARASAAPLPNEQAEPPTDASIAQPEPVAASAPPSVPPRSKRDPRRPPPNRPGRRPLHDGDESTDSGRAGGR